jgi:hypothetical protein
MSAEAVTPLRRPNEGVATGLVLRGRLMKIASYEGTRKDGGTFTTDVITVYSNRGGQTRVKAWRLDNGERDPRVTELEQMLPPEGSDELGQFVELQVRASAWGSDPPKIEYTLVTGTRRRQG